MSDLERLRTTINAEVRDRTALLDRRLAALRRAALAVYHGKIGFENPTDPDILALGAALFPETRACNEVVQPFRANCMLPRGHDGNHSPSREAEGIVQRAHVACCWCGEHHEEGR